MMGIVKRKIVWAFIFCLGSLIQTFAQPSLKTTIDKNGILIGEQLKLKVTATLPTQDFFVKWIEIPDTLPHFELVEKSKIDSTFSNQKLTGLSQTITFTSFDSGKWTIPSFNIDFNPSAGDTAYNFYTDTFSVTVSYLADSTTALKDIKAIRELKDEKPLWYWFAIAGGILLLVCIGIWLYNYHKKRIMIKPLELSISPYQRAMQQMDKLKQLNLSEAAAMKLYHSRLSEIIKEYLSAVQSSHFASSTTGEVLILLNQKGIDKTSMSNIAGVLRRSDAAKFAKYIPSIEESEQSWQIIKQAIDFIEQLQHKKEESGS